jgi:hypothetical protein
MDYVLKELVYVPTDSTARIVWRKTALITVIIMDFVRTPHVSVMQASQVKPVNTKHAKTNAASKAYVKKTALAYVIKDTPATTVQLLTA